MPSRPLIGYLILTIGVAVGLYFTWQNTRQITNERAARSVALNNYLARGCVRDARKDAIFIGILRDSIRAVRVRPGLDPAVRRGYIAKQQAK